LLVSRLKAKNSSRPGAECPPFNYQLKPIHYAQGLLLLAAAGLCAYGLIKSYSRGAWLGTAVGIGFLMWKFFNREPHEPREKLEQKVSNPLSCVWRVPRFATRVRLKWLPLAVLLASALVLSFWQFRHTENPLARRVFSIGNPNDFSWRNRVSTWAGAVTMMQDRPVLGYGWGKSEAVLGEKYKPVRLEDAAAIQMNDYLMLGISCGVPALLCFVAYLWLSFCRPMGASRARTELQTSDLRLQTSVVCFAGAMVLLVGFWFDGGLFKLPTAAVFWGLMELSRGSNRGHETQTSRALVRPVRGSSRRLLPVNKWQIGLGWLAGVLALLAIGQTVLHLGAPRFAVSERSLSIARQFLVPPKQKQDFEFLAAQPIWPAKRLGTLLDHVELANYNRELVNWKLTDDVYRRFVLSPPIDAALDGDMNWRRPLWESFYPRIRKENSLEAAAEIIVRLLRERVRVVEPSGSPETIVEIWQRGVASERGFEVISVAVLRSAGIPARLAERGRAVFWNGVEWQPFH
jgi:O-Antigen ligase/Transglutaminase-like superfamily